MYKEIFYKKSDEKKMNDNSNLQREVKCHELHNRPKAIVSSTNTNPCKTSLQAQINAWDK